MTRERNEIDPIEELSLRLNAAFQRPADPDWLDVRRRLRRLHRTRNRMLVLAGVLVVAVAACAQSTGIIPWFNHHPAPVKAPRSAPPCRVADLRVGFSYSVSLNGINGNLWVVNEGGRACSLAGRPRLKLIDPQVKKPRLLERYSVPKWAPGSFNPTPLSLLRAVPPHELAYLGFNWKNWCGPGPAPRAFELRLPEGGSIVHSFAPRDSNSWHVRSHLSLTAPRCENKRRQTELDYEPFYPGWAPKSVLGAYGVKSVLPLRVSVITKGLPTVRRMAKGSFHSWGPWRYVKGREYSFAKVKRGDVLHFRVALRNTSRRPFRFARCPLYVETLISSGTTLGQEHQETYVLNCHPVGAIAPGKVAYFAMELRVPKDQPLGQSFLGWFLVDANRGNGPRPGAVWVVP
jgi:hypothetical protein